jgi:hypothetical protein
MTEIEIINKIEPNGELLTTEMVLECMRIFSHQEMIAFAIYCSDFGVYIEKESRWRRYNGLDFIYRTTKELLQIYLKEKKI